MTYNEIRANLCLRYCALKPSDIDDMSWDLIEDLWNEGKPSKGIPVTSVEDARRIIREWRSYTHGL